MKIRNRIISFSLCAITLLASGYTFNNSVIVAEAHHGGGHHRGNRSYNTSYYCGGHEAHQHNSGICPYATDTTTDTGTSYYCGGHDAHQHVSGVCPYGTGTVTGTSSSTTSNSRYNLSDETIKQIQKALNDKGYDCGTADGICGSRTKAAITKFQEDNKLKVDGVAGAEVKEALNIKDEAKEV